MDICKHLGVTARDGGRLIVDALKHYGLSAAYDVKGKQVTNVVTAPLDLLLLWRKEKGLCSAEQLAPVPGSSTPQEDMNAGNPRLQDVTVGAAEPANNHTVLYSAHAAGSDTGVDENQDQHRQVGHEPVGHGQMGVDDIAEGTGGIAPASFKSAEAAQHHDYLQSQSFSYDGGLDTAAPAELVRQLLRVTPSVHEMLEAAFPMPASLCQQLTENQAASLDVSAGNTSSGKRKRGSASKPPSSKRIKVAQEHPSNAVSQQQQQQTVGEQDGVLPMGTLATPSPGGAEGTSATASKAAVSKMVDKFTSLSDKRVKLLLDLLEVRKFLLGQVRACLTTTCERAILGWSYGLCVNTTLHMMKFSMCWVHSSSRDHTLLPACDHCRLSYVTLLSVCLLGLRPGAYALPVLPCNFLAGSFPVGCLCFSCA